MDKKELILDTVSDFLYYDRKEDEDLGRDEIDKAVVNGIVTIEEIVAKFESELRRTISL